MKKALQDLSKPKNVKEHNNLQYHQTATLKAQKCRENYEGVDYDPNNDLNSNKTNIFLQRIIEAVLLCGKQGTPLRRHGEQDTTHMDKSIQRPPNQENFVAIIRAFAKHDEIHDFL